MEGSNWIRTCPPTLSSGSSRQLTRRRHPPLYDAFCKAHEGIDQPFPECILQMIYVSGHEYLSTSRGVSVVFVLKLLANDYCQDSGCRHNLVLHILIASTCHVMILPTTCRIVTLAKKAAEVSCNMKSMQSLNYNYNLNWIAVIRTTGMDLLQICLVVSSYLVCLM